MNKIEIKKILSKEVICAIIFCLILCVYYCMHRESYEGQKMCETLIQSNDNKFMCKCLYDLAQEKSIKNFEGLVLVVSDKEMINHVTSKAIMQTSQGIEESEEIKYFSILISFIDKCTRN